MDYNEWLHIGIKNKWCSVPYCETHEGSPLSNEEMDEFDDGNDPCVFAVRVYGDDDEG